VELYVSMSWYVVDAQGQLPFKSRSYGLWRCVVLW